jgi:hypothetical protein
MFRSTKFGILLGGTLGLLSTTIDLRMLRLMGYPDVLVRQGWEVFTAITMAGFGSTAGLAYAALLPNEACLEGVRKRESAIFVSTVIAAAVIYVIADYMSIKVLNILPWCVAQLTVFIVALLIARVLAGPPRGTSHSVPADKS